MSNAQLDETTIRDFGGGWNVSDSDKSLASRYQTLSDNIVRGTDGHFRKRFGKKLFAHLRKGTETVVAAASFTIASTSASGVLKITKTAHGYADGQHIKITTFGGGDFNGIDDALLLNRTFGIKVNDANNFSIYVRAAASSTGTSSRSIGWTHDTHVMSGRDIYGRYYKDNLIVFTEDGEIAAVNSSGVATIIWNYAIASGLTLEPWSYTKRVSAEIIRGRLIAVNGSLNDKPLAIDGTTVNYLVDAATLSNGAIPRAEFVIAASQYVVLVNTEYGPTMLEIGAKNTVMTCSRETDPSDAVEVDLGMLTQTVDATILGASVVRSRVFIGFTDRSMLGTLGIYNDSGTAPIHEPDFNDNVAEFGTFSHGSIISLGNDLFCAALNGINSLEISKASGEFVPQTVSDLIHPVMLRHFSRLSDDDRKYRTFAVFEPTSRSYILYAPKYSAGARTLDRDPVIATTTLQPHNLMYLRVADHVYDEGDELVIGGATGAMGVDEASVNGTRRIRAIVDKDTIIIETGDYTANTNTTLGGSVITIEPVSDETIGYAYEYNPRLKIRRWTRYRDLDFDWGARSQYNKMFYGKNGKIWHFGDTSYPYAADNLGEYDDLTYTASHAYDVGRRVLDASGTVYVVKVAYTSSAETDFGEERDNVPDNWEIYKGKPINFAMETAWSDFNLRMGNKQIEFCRFDSEGGAQFEFGVYTNSVYKDFESQLLAPNRVTTFVGQDSPGFGAGDQPFGGGRNTSTEMLHSIPAYGKLFKLRFSGSSIHPLTINAVTLLYHKTKVST